MSHLEKTLYNQGVNELGMTHKSAMEYSKEECAVYKYLLSCISKQKEAFIKSKNLN